MIWPRTVFFGGAMVALGVSICSAQFQRGNRRGGPPVGEGSSSLVWIEGGGVVDEDTVSTARESASHSTGTPNWSNPPEFAKDVFTFARILFKTDPNAVRGRGWGGPALGWWVDYPDADLNFSYRLQQMTAAKVDPDARVLRLADPKLCDYPLIYMEHAGYMLLSEVEVAALRNYLLSGGTLFVNDFWSTPEWEGFQEQMNRVLPNRAWTELSTDHPIFHAVFDLKGPMKRLQVPTIQFWNRDYDPNDPHSPLQRRYRGEGSEDMHVRAWLDDKQRIMIIAIHNSDVSDGWEREGEDDTYFHTFSEKVSYPLGINIVFYVMTH